MDPEKDAYGAAIRDHHEGGDAFELIERDDGFVDLTGGPETYFQGYEEWPERQRVAVDSAEGRVLDVGCGAGRHALSLQGESEHVVGIDVSPGAVEVARDRGLDDAVELGVEDVRALERTFDDVVMLGNNFGLVGTRDRAPGVLSDLAAVTGREARIFAETRDPHATDDPVHLSYHQRNRERGRLPGAVRMRARYREYATDWFDYLMVSVEEMRGLLYGTPWELGEVVDGEAGTYVAVLEKA